MNDCFKNHEYIRIMFAIDEGVKAWVLFMMMRKFVVEIDDAIVMNYGEISDLYVNDYASMIHC